MTVNLSINDDIIDKATRDEMPVLNTRMRAAAMSAEELAAHISAGKAFCCAQLTSRPDGFATRNAASWQGAQIFAIDIDNSFDDGGTKRKRTDEEGYVTVDDLRKDEYLMRHAWLIYTTPSHTDAWHRVRVVFCAPEVFTQAEHYKTCIDAFIARFGADTAASSIVNTFYGSSRATMHVIGRVLTIDAMRETVERYKAVQTEERKLRLYTSGAPPVEQTKAMLALIPSQLDYLDWVRVVSGVASVYDAATAEEIVSAWSPGERGEVAYKIRHRMQGVGFGTVVYIARRYGWNPPVGFYNDAEPRKTKDAERDAEKYMTAFYRTRFNIVRSRVEYASIDDASESWAEVTDYVMHSLLREMRAEHIKITKERLYELITSNYSAHYDPMRDYFDKLPAWDGVDRIAVIAECLRPQSERERVYVLSVLQCWLISAVACAVDYKANHIVPILQGKQGTYKSTFITSLCPDQLRDYMHIGTVTGDKDSLIALAETFLFIDDELETINRKEIGIFKRIVTQSDIKVRAPYGRMTETRKRRASFIGSVNRTTFLNDETGSRRFPVLVVNGFIDMALRWTVDTAQLWAQAHAQYRSGVKHWFDAEDVEVIEQHNAAHQHRSSADELLSRWYMPCSKDDAGMGVFHLTSTEVAMQIVAKLASVNTDMRMPITDQFTQAIGKALHAQGFTRYGRKSNGGTRYVWAVRESTDRPMHGAGGGMSGMLGTTGGKDDESLF